MKNQITAFMMVCLAAITTHAGDRIGNGGDEVSMEFLQAFSSAMKTIANESPELSTQVSRANLEQVLAGATLLVVSDALPVERYGVVQDSIAVNDASTKRIFVNRFRWTEIRDPHVKEAIAFHEVASLAGLESTGKYPLTARYLALVGLSPDAEVIFTIECGRAESNALRRVHGYFAAGEVSRTDVAKAELNLYQAQLQCQSITKEKFCASAPRAANTMAVGTLEESRVGMRTDDELTEAERREDQVKAFCR